MGRETNRRILTSLKTKNEVSVLPSEICEAKNLHFTDIGPKLAQLSYPNRQIVF